MSNALIIFAKAPHLGTVKTRLQAALPATHVRKLYIAFVRDTLAIARRVRGVQRRVIAFTADDGAPLLRELSGLRKFKVRRFRIVYEIDAKTRTLRIFAVGHRREIYEDLVERLRKTARRRR